MCLAGDVGLRRCCRGRLVVKVWSSCGQEDDSRDGGGGGGYSKGVRVSYELFYIHIL